MSLFICTKCQVIENTALSSYWYNPEHLCSKCDPKIAKWHRCFDRIKFNPATDKIVDGFVERN